MTFSLVYSPSGKFALRPVAELNYIGLHSKLTGMPFKFSITFAFVLHVTFLFGQQLEILPPVQPWKGKSLSLIAKKEDPWITPSEKSDFTTTPSYSETYQILKKMCEGSAIMKIISIGKSAQGRDIWMVIATADGNIDSDAIKKSGKQILLIQAGIHAGEIDGKDAGMMLLRDISFGKKKDLLKNVTILFVPILNVDGHERTSPYNRVNQRGPSNMGWRTNGKNLNLNRDYTKLDSEEIRAVVQVMNEYDPTLYLDLHVTDGADYQYDITYGYVPNYSPSVYSWLDKTLKPYVNDGLKTAGHIPGPLMFAANDRDFSKGNMEYPFEPRFSNNYGHLRHMPSILLENHSLKPYKQRVLGTYVFLERIIEILNTDGANLKKAISSDKSARETELVLTWKQSEKTDSMTLLGIESQILKSKVTNKDYVSWTGKSVTRKIPVIQNSKPDKIARRPKRYWVPSTYADVIERMKIHGIKMETIMAPVEVSVRMYKVTNHKFATAPFEGHFAVTGTVTAEIRKETFYPGSVKIDMDQPLGDLVMHLLEPEGSDSFFAWGFFHEIFNRTEYIEEYVIEPLARNMLASDKKLSDEYEAYVKTNPGFTDKPQEVYEWFYTRSSYVDSRYLLYPVGMED
jgi:murein tripeptide amidase MpaA